MSPNDSRCSTVSRASPFGPPITKHRSRPSWRRSSRKRANHEVEEEEIPGVVVARVNLSDRFMRELIDAMEDNYSKWRTRQGIKNLPEFEGRNESDEREG